MEMEDDNDGMPALVGMAAGGQLVHNPPPPPPPDSPPPPLISLQQQQPQHSLQQEQKECTMILDDEFDDDGDDGIIVEEEECSSSMLTMNDVDEDVDPDDESYAAGPHEQHEFAFSTRLLLAPSSRRSSNTTTTAENCSGWSIAEQVPDELWRRILADRAVGPRELTRMAAVNSRFYRMAGSISLWRLKMEQAPWPLAYHNITRMLARPENADLPPPNWFTIYRCRCAVRPFVAQKLRELSRLYIVRSDVFVNYAELECFFDAPNQELTGPEIAILLVLDELRMVVNRGEINNNEVMTDTFYATQALRYVAQCMMKLEFKEWLKDPQAPLVIGAAISVIWFQPSGLIKMKPMYLKRTDAFKKFDEFAMQVIGKLRQSHPKHPACQIQCPYSMDPTRPSQWSPSDSRTLVQVLNACWRQEIGFSGATEDYYKPANSFLDTVIERRKGIPITLCIIYAGLAQSLGINARLIPFPYHIMVKVDGLHLLCQPSSSSTIDVPDSERYCYIDPFGECEIMSQSYMWAKMKRQFELNDWNESLVQPASNISIIIRMCNNLARPFQHSSVSDGSPGAEQILSALELIHLLQPADPVGRLKLSHFYYHLNDNFNLDIVQDLLRNMEVPTHLLHLEAQRQNLLMQVTLRLNEYQHQLEQEEEKRNRQKLRTVEQHRNVLFSVGMMMRHKRYDYRCVVYGWDKECMLSEDWQSQMGVPNLPCGHRQPFYNVMVADNTNRYAAQENLEFEKDCSAGLPIEHREIGKYFDSFHGNHYRMNPERSAQYPHDEMFTLNHVHQFYNNKNGTITNDDNGTSTASTSATTKP